VPQTSYRNINRLLVADHQLKYVIFIEL